jgi:hypothetical protein
VGPVTFIVFHYDLLNALSNLHFKHLFGRWFSLSSFSISNLFIKTTHSSSLSTDIRSNTRFIFLCDYLEATVKFEKDLLDAFTPTNFTTYSCYLLWKQHHWIILPI